MGHDWCDRGTLCSKEVLDLLESVKSVAAVRLSVVKITIDLTKGWVSHQYDEAMREGSEGVKVTELRGEKRVPDVSTRCSAAYWAECERHRGGAVNANERETGDLLPSAVSLHYTTRELEENRGRAVTGTRIKDDVEALGARNCEVGRGVATRSRRDGDVNTTRGSRTSRVVDTGGKGTWKQVGTCQEHCKDWNTLFDMFPAGTFCTHPECHAAMHLQFSHQEHLIYIWDVISTCS